MMIAKLKEALTEYKDKDLDKHIWFTRLFNEKGEMTLCKIQVGSSPTKEAVYRGEGDDTHEALEDLEWRLRKGYVKN